MIPKPTKADRLLKRSRIDTRNLALPKQTNTADPRYRERVRRAGCQLAKHAREKHPKCSPQVGSDYTKRPLIQFAHVPGGGVRKAMGRKVSDVGGGIGLCANAHAEQTQIGWPRFIAKYGIDPIAIAEALARTLDSDCRNNQEKTK